MRRRVVSTLLLGALLVPSPSLADACKRIQGVSAGERVPCDGVLWTSAATAEAIRCKTVDLPRAAADLDLCVLQAAGERNTLQARLQAAQGLADQRAEELARALVQLRADPPTPAWYASPTLWGVIGLVAGGVGVYYGTRALQ